MGDDGLARCASSSVSLKGEGVKAGEGRPLVVGGCGLVMDRGEIGGCDLKLKIGDSQSLGMRVERVGG